MKTITIQDESATGKIIHELLLELTDEIIKVKDLIRMRVEYEVDQYNANQQAKFQGLVQPTDLEQRLNQHSASKKPLVDAEKQYYVAMKAFQSNGFFILADNRQLIDPEEEIILNESIAISFIKLTPLVGG